MVTCCCTLAGTRACLTCPNSMAGTYARYPAPYWKDWTHDFMGVPTEGQLREEQEREKFLALLLSRP